MPTDRWQPFELEVKALAEEIGLSPEQHKAVARFVREQMDETMNAAIELAAEDPEPQPRKDGES